MISLTGGQIIRDKLLKHSIKNVYVYTGGAIMPVIDSLYNTGIDFIINTNEQSLGYSAVAQARVTQKPTFAIVTSGPGLTNMLTAITDAKGDCAPLITLSGQVPLKAIGTNAFQECPATEMTKSVTKWSYLVQDIKELPDVMEEAINISTSGKPGPVHIDLPKCITSSKLDFYPFVDYSSNFSKFNNNTDNIKKYTDTEFDRIIKLINISKNPVIIAGQGCNKSYKLLRKFVNKANIPITTTIHANGIFDETNYLSLEFLGMHGNVAANKAVQNADLIINLGGRFDDRTTGNTDFFAPKANEAFSKGKGGIIHVNKSNKELNSVIQSHYNFNLDCEDFLNNIVERVTYKDRYPWIGKIQSWKLKYPFDMHASENQINTQEVISGINDYLLDNKIDDYYITTGVGNHQMMTSQFIKWRYPGRFITSGSLGVMGVGLPYAIGCQLSSPNSLVLDIDGDGSFNHTLSELKTVQNYNLPIKIAIMNDSRLSMVQAWENLFFDERYAATDLLENPDYEKLADSFGIMSMTCDSRKDLKQTIQEFMEYDEAILCDFRVQSDLCLPLVAPGKALDDILTLKNIQTYNNKNAQPPS